MKATEWRELGDYEIIDNCKIFVIDSYKAFPETKNKDLPVMVILHGYPVSSYDFHKILYKLAQHYRVILHDHLGFGFSDKPVKHSYTIIEQAKIAIALWEKMELKNFAMLSHGYGGSVATEVLALYNNGKLNFQLDKLLFCNGNMHEELSRVFFIQRLLMSKVFGYITSQLATYASMRRAIRNVYYDPSKITEEELKAIWEIGLYNKGRKVFHKLSRFIKEREVYWDRWIGALRETNVHCVIIWSKNDPITAPIVANLMAIEISYNELHWMDNTGYFSMMESPDEWLNIVLN